MTEFEVYPFSKSTVAYLNGLRPSINIKPIYQRQGEVWTLAKQRLLIDSIINGFDIPKIYFHAHSHWVEEDGNRYKYSLVDGRQRLEAIWDFLDGKFTLDDDFILLEDGSAAAAGRTYSELVKKHPDIATTFGATKLDVMLIRTDDTELIEEMFSRLNEAVPLNAAEKRNGRGGPLRSAVIDLSRSTFFKERLPFGNTRYRHYDLSTKFMLWAESGRITDTKKHQLDEYWSDVKHAPNGSARAKRALTTALAISTSMSETFVDKDKLLSSVGMVSVYYLLFQKLLSEKKPMPTRTELEAFETVRRLKRPVDEDSLTLAQQRLLDFDRLAQSANDESALATRVAILGDYLSHPDRFIP